MTTAPAPGSSGAATAQVVAAALGFALISILTIVATRDGMPLTMYLLVRFASATLVLAPLAWREAGAWGSRRTTLRILLAGGVGQSLVGVLTLASLQWIPAATLVVLFYTFPAWVTLLAAWRGVERLTPSRVLALSLSLAGILVLVGWPGSGGIHPLGASLALAAAVVYAIYVPVMAHLQRGMSTMRTTTLVTTGVTIVFLVVTVLRGEFGMRHTGAAWGAALATGIFSTALALLLFLRGLVVLGPVRTSIASTVEPIFAAVLAAAILGQPVTRAMVAGGLLIVAGVVVLTRGSPTPDR